MLRSPWDLAVGLNSPEFCCLGAPFTVITHVLVCTGPIQQVANPDNGFTYKLPTRVLARLNADLFAPNGTRDPNLGRLLSERPPSLSKAIGDVVRDIATDTAPGPGWSVTGGRPYTVYGGNQNGRCVVDLDLLIAAVSQDGQFHKVDGFDQIVRAAARWGTPQAAGRPGRRGSAAQPA